MTHISDPLLAAVVRPMPNSFDSHEVIQVLMTKHPKEYVSELYQNVRSDDPIRVTHSEIGRALHRVPGLRTNGRVDSVNVRGPVTENQRWQK